MLLHSQEAFPFVNEEGFALQAGVHTYVAMQKEEIKLLPDPYGYCNATSGYSQSHCLAHCYIQYIGEECGCVDLYMLQYTGSCIAFK